jgi:hypothetical protein
MTAKLATSVATVVSATASGRVDANLVFTALSFDYGPMARQGDPLVSAARCALNALTRLR